MLEVEQVAKHKKVRVIIYEGDELQDDLEVDAAVVLVGMLKEKETDVGYKVVGVAEVIFSLLKSFWMFEKSLTDELRNAINFEKEKNKESRGINELVNSKYLE